MTMTSTHVFTDNQSEPKQPLCESEFSNIDYPFIDFYGLGIDCFELAKDGGCFFIGASVTAQKKGWSDKLVNLISEKLGSVLSVRKRVMGGVGILFGLTNWPNLDLPEGGVVFIEFSTGDLNSGLTPVDRLATLLESLIVDILNKKSFPIIVHNWRSDYRGEKGDVVRGIYGAVASRFRIPVIRNDLFTEAKIAEDPSVTTTWFRDICHTTPEGVTAYATHVFKAISLLASQNAFYPSYSKPFDNIVGRIEPFLHLEQHFSSSQYIKSTYAYPNTGQEFTFYDCPISTEFEAIGNGDLMAIAFISGPRAGWVELLIDGEKKRVFRCFDQHSYYERFIMFPFFYKLTNNSVKIRLSQDSVDFTIAKKGHDAFKEERRMQLVAIVGVGLEFTVNQPVPKMIEF